MTDQRNGVAVEEEPLDIRRYLGVVLSRWWLVLLGPVIAGLVAWAYSERQTPVYEATTTMRVQQSQRTAIASIGEIQTNRSLAVTYKELITMRPVMEGVVQELGLPMSAGSLGGKVSVDQVSGTELLRIRVEDSDPGQAALIADTVAEVFKRQTEENRLADIARLQSSAIVQGISNVQDLVTAQLNALESMSVVELAAVPSSPIRPRTSLNIMLAVVLGVLFSIGGAFALEYLHDTVKTSESVERRFGITGLGAVPRWPKKELGANELVMEKLPKSNFAEAYRNIRANIQFINAARPVQAFVVSSTRVAEGKSTVIANLTVSEAQAGRSAILVDSDLRRPTLHRFFHLDNTFGLSSYLANPEVEVRDVLQGTNIEGVRVITSGPIPPNPAELLGSKKMGSLIQMLKQEADVVIFDSPPLLSVVDGSLLASQLDGVLIVAASDTRMDLLRVTLETLRKANAHLMGVLANKVAAGGFGYGYYHRYYYYSNGDGSQPATNGVVNLVKGPVNLVKSAWKSLPGRKQDS